MPASGRITSVFQKENCRGRPGDPVVKTPPARQQVQVDQAAQW